MAMKQFNADEMRKKIQETKTEECNLQTLDRGNEIIATIKDMIEKMPHFIEELKKPTSEENLMEYAKNVTFLMKNGAKIAASDFEKRVSEILKKANRDDKITLTTTSFYIILILMVYLLIFFGAVVFGNFKAIHSDSLSELIFWISLGWFVSMGLFLWLKKYFMHF